jgi:tRNA nucleotidyltransferase (CCA-adding enzyme)
VSEPSPADLLERLRALPGGPELLELAPPGAFLVGGAVRDLLLDRRPRELDVVVEDRGSTFGDSAALLAGKLASRFNVIAGSNEGERFGSGAKANEHERFGTAIVEWEAGRIDIATARCERYSAPGALPEVEPAALAEDLTRRDFTVNALAAALGGPRPGEMHAAPFALEDLRAGRLRVLHERSFTDDPTRLFRLARYRARLGFAVEERTAALASAAVAGGALATVSGARIGSELRLALGEADAVAALTALDDLGLLAALNPRLRFDADLAREALGLLSMVEAGAGPDPRPDLLLAAALLQPMACDIYEGNVEEELYALLDDMEFPAADRDLVLHEAICADSLAEELAGAEEGSEIYEAVAGHSLEGVALAGALGLLYPGDLGFAACRWLTELRNVRLEITGHDLLAAGIPQGPEIGRRLEAALRAKLDGELDDGRDAELAAALEAAWPS